MNLRAIHYIALAAASCLGTQASAQLVMTDAAFSSMVDNQSQLVSFEIDDGGVTYFPNAIATYNDAESAANPSDYGWNNTTAANPTGGDPIGEPAGAIAAISDVYVTTNAFALRNGSVFDLNTTVNDGDGSVLFVTEHLGNDNNITVTPLDSSYDAISTWTLDLDGSDYAGITSTSVYDYNNQGNAIAGTTFTLSDFTGGTGTLTSVAALQIDGANNLDPALIGVAATIPEPMSYTLLLGAAVLLGALRRRRA